MSKPIYQLSEYRQIIAYLRRHGPTHVTKVAREGCLDRGKVSDRAWTLEGLGLLTRNSGGMLSLTPKGETIDLGTEEEKKRFHPAEIGMRPKQVDRRLEDKQRAERRESREKRKYQRLAEREEFETHPTVEPLPDEFVDDAVLQLREHVRVGNFSALHHMVDSLTEQYAAYTLEASPLRSRPLGERLATYLTECRDARGERINVRIVNSVEQICPATLGAILEHWPLGFLAAPNLGIIGIRTIGQVLLAAGLIDRKDYIIFIRRYALECKAEIRKQADGEI